MPNLTVSSVPVDDFMQSASKPAAANALGVAYVYPTVAALTADANVTAFAAGDTVQLNGYYAAGDFGKPVTLVIEATTGGVKSHTLTDGRYANLYATDEINVLWFGAKGDRSTDNRAAFQEAIDAVFDNVNDLFTGPGPRTVFVPAGNYYISTSATITDRNGASVDIGLNLSGSNGTYKTSETQRLWGINFVGEDSGGGDGASTFIIMNTQVDAALYFYGGTLSVENIRLFGRGQTYRGFWGDTDWWTTGYAIRESTFRNVRFTECYTGIEIAACWKTEFQHVKLDQCFYGGKIDIVTSTNFRNIQCSRYVVNGLYIGPNSNPRYSGVYGMVAEQVVRPTNHLMTYSGSENPYTNPIGTGSSPTTDWITDLQTNFAFTFTRAQWEDPANGYAIVLDSDGTGSFYVTGLGSEYLHNAGLVYVGGSSRVIVNVDGFEADGGTAWLPDKIGTVNATQAVPAVNGSITIATTADYRGSISVDDYVIIAKRRYVGSGTPPAVGEYLGPDDIINLPYYTTRANTDTLLYGMGYIVTAITASDITVERPPQHTGGLWPIASDYPTGVEQHVAGDYLFKVTPVASKPTFRVNNTFSNVYVNGGRTLGISDGIMRYENAREFSIVDAGTLKKTNVRHAYLDSAFTAIFETIDDISSRLEGNAASGGIEIQTTDATNKIISGSFASIGTGDLTLSVLLNFVSSDDDTTPLIGLYNGTSRIAIYGQGIQGRVTMRNFDGSTTAETDVVASGSLGAWNRVTITRESGVIKAYLNAGLAITSSYAGTIDLGTPVLKDDPGAGITATYQIADVIVFDRALSASEIDTRYNTGDWIPADEANAVARYPFTEGVSAQARDEIGTNDLKLASYTWFEPKKDGYIRDFNLDANGAAAYVIANEDILPDNAIITRVLIKNNDGDNIAAGALDINRYDGTNRATIGDNAAQIDAGDGSVIFPDATQDLADKRIEIPDNSDIGMDDFDIRVDFEVIG